MTSKSSLLDVLLRNGWVSSTDNPNMWSNDSLPGSTILTVAPDVGGRERVNWAHIKVDRDGSQRLVKSHDTDGDPSDSLAKHLKLQATVEEGSLKFIVEKLLSSDLDYRSLMEDLSKNVS